jgi:hypothetical protein
MFSTLKCVLNNKYFPQRPWRGRMYATYVRDVEMWEMCMLLYMYIAKTKWAIRVIWSTTIKTQRKPSLFNIQMCQIIRVDPDASEQTCLNFKPRNYHEMCTNSTRMVLSIYHRKGHQWPNLYLSSTCDNFIKSAPITKHFSWHVVSGWNLLRGQVQQESVRTHCVVGCTIRGC